MVTVLDSEVDLAGMYRLLVSDGDRTVMLKFSSEPPYEQVEAAFIASLPPEPPEVVAEDGTVL